jgi:CheY-like chemotaxis protein
VRLRRHRLGFTEGTRLRVLIVEDDATQAELVVALLGLEGYDVRSASTGPEGIRAARDWRPDVVLCDFDLPGCRGPDMAAALRRDPATAGIRLIAFTGEVHPGEGFDDHFVKGDDPERLLGWLARVAGWWVVVQFAVFEPAFSGQTRSNCTTTGR